MVGAIRVTLEQGVAADEAQAIADAIALLRTVIMVDGIAADPQMQIVDAQARQCVRLDWPKIVEDADVGIRKGAERVMFAILASTCYEHGAMPVVDAIKRIRGVESAVPEFVEDGHADAVSGAVTRIKGVIRAVLTS